MHRPCLSVFDNLDYAWAMFRSTMVTGYLGRSSLLWPGELVIRSTITYGEEVVSIGGKYFLAVWPAVAERVSDWINHHIQEKK